MSNRFDIEGDCVLVVETDDGYEHQKEFESGETARKWFHYQNTHPWLSLKFISITEKVDE